MNSGPGASLEAVQRIAARLIATNPVGEGLRLVGGLRYRLLDGSPRVSQDIDYHWEGDLEEKRDETLGFLRKKLLPEVRRRFGFEGSAEAARGPDAESAFVKTIGLAFFKAGRAGGRIELPVDVTRIACLDPPVVRTVGGTVYLTASDADMVESKVVAILERAFVQDRDLLDLFLFQDALPPDAGARLREKLSRFSIAAAAVEGRIARLRRNAGVHARGVDAVIEQQVDEPIAANLRQAGGGKMICDAALRRIERIVGT